MPTLLKQLQAPLDPERLIIAPGVSREHEPAVINAYRNMFLEHEGGPTNLTVVDYDDVARPEQRLDVVGIRRKQADIATIRLVSKAGYRHAPDLEAQFLGHSGVLREVLDEIIAGNDVNFAYDHSSLSNIVIGGAAARGALFTFAESERSLDLTLEEDGIIGKGITVVDALGAPAARVPALNWDTFIGIPMTRRIEESAVLSRVCNRVNIAMLRAFIGKRSRGSDQPDEPKKWGKIHHAAPSASGDITKVSGPPRKRKTTVHMGPTNRGTGSVMMRGKTLPLGVTLGNEGPTLTVGELVTLSHPDELHVVMEGIAMRNTEATSNEHVYHRTFASLRAAIE